MIRGLWDREMVALILLAAVMPIALVWLWHGGTAALSRLLLTLLVASIWHLLFMLVRAQPPSFAGALTALAVAMLAPVELNLFQLVLGISFGVVMAELVMGGWGRNVLNPATVTLAFLGFGFPAAAWPDLALPVAWAAIPAALMGMFTGVIPARILLAGLLSAALALGAGLPVEPKLPAAGLVLVLLVADPVASASTRAGGWMNGLLYGVLMTLFAVYWEQTSPVQMAVSAALLASLAAPILDEIAIATWLLRRRRRHG